MENTQFVSAKIAKKTLGVCNRTLNAMCRRGELECIRINNGWRKYNIHKYLLSKDKSLRKKICYARVSSHDQKKDLETQIKLLEDKYPEYEIVKDIGSGINFKRKGLNYIIDLSVKNELDEVVITYKDRLCRIGFELIEMLMEKYSNAKITILNNEEKLPHEMIADDLIEIITVYSSKIHGMRSNKITEKKEENT